MNKLFTYAFCLLLTTQITGTTLNLVIDFTTKNSLTLQSTWTYVSNDNGNLIFELDNNLNIQLTEVKVNNKNSNYTWENNLLEIENSVINSELTVEVSYNGNPDKNNNQGLHFSQGENFYTASCSSFPSGFASWIPIPKEPNVTFSVKSSFKVLPNYSVITNGELQDSKEYGNFSEFNFEETRKIKPYQLFFRIASETENYQSTIQLETKNIQFNLFPYPGYSNEAKTDFEKTEDIVQTLEKNFGLFPYEKLDFAVFNFSKVISIPKISAISKNFITGDNINTDKIVNGIAGQWWGSFWGIANLNHAWVTQGLKTYSEVIYKEHIFNDTEISSSDFCGNILENYDLGDASLFEQLVFQEDDPFEHPYVLNNKGAYTFQMLRKLTGDNLFFKSLRYLIALEFPNVADTDKVQFAFEKTCNRDFDYFIQQWGYSPSRPYLLYSINNENNKVQLDIKQVQENNRTYSLLTELVSETEKLQGFCSHRTQKLIFDSNSNFQFDPFHNLLKNSMKSETSLIEGNIDCNITLKTTTFPFEIKIEPTVANSFSNYEIMFNNNVVSEKKSCTILSFSTGKHIITYTGIKEDDTAISRIKEITIPVFNTDVDENGFFTLSDISKTAKSIGQNDIAGDINLDGKCNIEDLKTISYIFLNSEQEEVDKTFSNCNLQLTSLSESITVGTPFSIAVTLNTDTKVNTVFIKLIYDKNLVKPLKVQKNSYFSHILSVKNNYELGIIEILIADIENGVTAENDKIVCTVDFMPLSAEDSATIKIENSSVSQTENSSVLSFETGDNILSSGAELTISATPEHTVFSLIMEDEEKHTSLCIINPQETETIAEISAYNSLGDLIETATKVIKGNCRVNYQLTELFELAEHVASITIESTKHLVSYNEIKATDNSFSIGIPGCTKFKNNLILPHIDESSQWNTYLSVLNSNETYSNANLENNLIPDISSPNSLFFDRVSSIFENQNLPENLNWGQLSSESGKISGAEFFLRVDNQTHGAGLLLNNQAEKTFYFSHIDITNFWWTGIAIVNPNSTSSTVTLQAYDKFGNKLQNSEDNKGVITFDIKPYGKIVDLVENYFERKLDDDAAWIKLTSNNPVTGYEVFGSVEGSFADLAAGIEGVSQGFFELYQPVNIDNLKGFWTGLALININDTLIANNITLKGFDINGEVVALKALTLNPNEKKVFLLRNIFSTETNAKINWIKIESSVPLTGFTLFGPETMERLTGLNLLN